jgi:hypothetical protein
MGFAAESNVAAWPLLFGSQIFKQPDDIINVAAGTYAENVVITTSGLRLHGTRGAVTPHKLFCTERAGRIDAHGAAGRPVAGQKGDGRE